MSTPVKCPICEGRGKVPNGFYDLNSASASTSTDSAPEECRACQGTGLLWTWSGEIKPPKKKKKCRNRRKKEDFDWPWPNWDDPIYIGDVPYKDTIIWCQESPNISVGYSLN